MNQTAFVIEGMICEACARHVERALNALPGVEANVSWPAGSAMVRKDAGVSDDTLEHAVRSAGYRVAPAAGGPRRPGDGSGLHIVVIGSGGSAFAAAIQAAENGAHVTMVERGTLGGTCVNVGCVPSKILLRAAETHHQRDHHPFEGVPAGGGTVERPALLGQLERRIEALRHDKYERILGETDNIELIRGEARLTGTRALAVERTEGETVHLAPDRILLATGASPTLPPIPGLADTPWWTSTDTLFTNETPQHLAVIGGSFVACEIAQAFHRLGSTVTILARSRLLSYEAPEVGDTLQSAFEAEGIRVLAGQQALQVTHEGARFGLALDDKYIEADRLLVAAGRTPNTADLDLGKAGVETDRQGAIRVDAGLRTSADGIYAVGDCATLPQLVYVAAAAGTRAAVNMTGGDAELDLSVLPSVIFTDPQIAAVGLDEQQARAAGIETVSRRLELEQVPRALANFDTRGFVRLIAESGSGRLLGARVVAHNGGEIIQTAALAIRANMTVDDLGGELFPYLTLSESLKLCAQTFTKDVNQLSCCAG